jgi:hypothetical protein
MSVLRDLGLVKVDRLEQLLGHYHEGISFLIDSNNLNQEEFKLFPLLKNHASVSDHALFLYGIGWHYRVPLEDPMKMSHSTAPLEMHLDEHTRHKHPNLPMYFFTQRYLKMHDSLWRFEPETFAWELMKGTYQPRYVSDAESYKNEEEQKATIRA